MTVYFLDTNVLGCIVNPNHNPETRERILRDVERKLQQDDTSFVSSQLARYEILRDVDWDNSDKFQDFLKHLSDFPFLDITKPVSDLASDLYRFDKFDAGNRNVDKNLDKRKFDVFHYATAVVNEVEMFSYDRDLEKIKELHQRMLEQTNHIQAA